MKFLRLDDFLNCADGQYPYGWKLEHNCDNSNRLAGISSHRFHLFAPGNKHIVCTPPLKWFHLELTVRCDELFSPAGITIFFHYNEFSGRGMCLDYIWGKAGEPRTNGQKKLDFHSARLSKYDRKNCDCHKTLIAEEKIPPFLNDISSSSRLRLEVNEGHISFAHNGRLVANFEYESSTVGWIAFDRPELWSCYSLELERLELESEVDGSEEIIQDWRTMEFPGGVNGIVSPVFYHWRFLKRCGLQVLQTKLTGGPPLTPRYPDLGRFSLGELLYSPYLRLETIQGEELGKYYIRHGSVGLTPEHWNVHCTVLPPAEFGYPAEAEFYLSEVTDDIRVIPGYEKYVAEDSLSTSGGPAEAISDTSGAILFAGTPLGCSLQLVSNPDRLVVLDIPDTIPFRERAVNFAKNNFFYKDGEPIRFQVRLCARKCKIHVKELSLRLFLEDAFQRNWKELSSRNPRSNMELQQELPDFQQFEYDCNLEALPCGVYHLRAEMEISGEHYNVRRAIEVMTGDIRRTAALVSGLPALYSNIISGTKSEHFYPWSETVNDVMHYQTGGSLFLKVGHDWQASRLLHIYGRPWLCWLSRNCHGVFHGNLPEDNQDVIADADYVADYGQRNDCWSIPHYHNPKLRKTLAGFLCSASFEPSSEAVLTPEKVSDDPNEPLTETQFGDLVRNHWKKWISFCCEEYTREAVEYHERLIRCGAKGFYAFCSPMYPTYGSVYKSDYFLMWSKGCDPRRFSPDTLLDGPNGVEDYPYSSKYRISRGVFQMAAMKLTFPKLSLNPEAFGVNGETADAHVTFAHPTLGVSSPPEGFYEKLFYEYSFGVCWFRNGKFSFWNDHGYHIRGWCSEHYSDMLKAYSFIADKKPEAPLRTAGFVLSLDSCLHHPEYYEKDDDLFLGGYVSNTAEEAVPFAYECAREAGQNAGFLTRMEDLEQLKADDVSLLVLPPLGGVPDSALDRIMKLHREGVSLLVFENPAGLADLFGVAVSEKPERIRTIRATERFAELNGMSETTEHPLCVSYLTNKGGEVFLESGEGVPVLTMNTTAWGKTAIFHIPPTVVRRARDRYPTYGQQSLSRLINRACSMILDLLAVPSVTVSEGKTISFRNADGRIFILISEDHWPEEAHAIHPILTIRIPDSASRKLAFSEPFTLLEKQNDFIRIRFGLKAHQSAIMELT